MKKETATLVGLSAVLLWSSTVALLRGLAQFFGETYGIALIYSLGSCILIVMFGLPRLRTYTGRYIIICGILFVLGQAAFAVAVAYAENHRQSIEISMINYMWPSLTILFSIIFNRQKANFAIIPGMFISVWGIAWVIGGDAGLDINSIITNIKDNPLSYILALVAAVSWASYSAVASNISEGKNAITWFFIFTALALWVQSLVNGAPENMSFSIPALGYLLMGALVVAFGTAAWNTGILHGNVALLATASYFIPVFSAGIAAVALDTALPFAFWQGAGLVCLGSLLCFFSVRRR